MKGYSMADALGALMILIVVGMFIVIGVQLNDGMVSDQYTSTAVTNESHALVNGTAAALTHDYCSAITQVGNATITVGSANYSCTGSKDGSTITVTMVTSSNDDIFGGTYNVSYSYNNPDNSKIVGDNATLGIMEVATNMELFGLIIIMGIIVSILFVAFGGFMGKSGGI